MKLTITNLKAPWPAGTKVGDIIDLPAVPVWAVGKCRPALDDAEPTAKVEVAAAVDPLAALRAEADAFIERQRADHAAQLAELESKVAASQAEAADALQKLSASDEAKAAAEAKVAELESKVAAFAAKPEGNPTPKKKG